MRSIWIYAASLLVLIGIAAREPAPLAFGILVLLTGGLSRLWSKVVLVRIRYERHLPVRRAFVGERFDIDFILSNPKPVPVPWIEVRDAIPQSLRPEDAAARSGAVGDSLVLSRSTSLAWYERVRWRQRVHCRARGFYQLGPVTFRSGDIFGFFPVSAEAWVTDELAVLPRLLDLREIGLPPFRPFGEVRSGNPIFEDPSRIVGVRDYRAGDPFRRIDWKATARRQTLQSRLYDPAAALTLLVAVSVTTLEHPWEGYDPLLLERAVAVAGSIARYAEEKRLAFGLAANCTFPNADRHIWLPPSRSPEQLVRVLEALAMISPFVLAPMEDVLEGAMLRLPFGATLVLVAGFMAERLRAYLSRGRFAGSRFLLVWVGDEPAPDLGPRVQVYDAGPHLRELERGWQADHAGAGAEGAWSAEG